MKKMVLAFLMAVTCTAALAQQESLYEDTGEVISAQDLFDGYMHSYRMFADRFTYRRAVITGIADDPYPAMGRVLVGYQIEGASVFESVHANLDYSPGSFGGSIQAGDPLSMSCVVTGFDNGSIFLKDCHPAPPY